MELTEELDWIHVDFMADVEDMRDLLRTEFLTFQRQLNMLPYWQNYNLEFLLRFPHSMLLSHKGVKPIVDRINGLMITFEAEEDEDFDYLLAVCYTAFREVGLGLRYQPALRYHFGNYWTCTVVD